MEEGIDKKIQKGSPHVDLSMEKGTTGEDSREREDSVPLTTSTSSSSSAKILPNPGPRSNSSSSGGSRKKPLSTSSSSPPPSALPTLPSVISTRSSIIVPPPPVKAPPPPTLPEKARSAHHKAVEHPTQKQCLGNRSYADVTVATYKADTPLPEAVGESCSTDGATAAIDSVNFYYGNPFVEKTSGILHFYKKYKSRLQAATPAHQCSMLCMLAVPAFVTCRELIQFVGPMSEKISEMKIIRDDSPNQYMAIINFKAASDATAFYHQYNDVEFNSIEAEKCTLLFVERIETSLEEEGGSLPVDSLAELPTCSVCLERMDDGVLTILCNHSFHAECLQKWADTTCPVCRYTQTPELVPDQACFDCGRTSDLWMCLICGNIGCGRYAEAHANRHYEATSHIFTLQVGGKMVWDYVGDNYVHRLVQGGDGKMVEYQGGGEDPDKENDKISTIQLEYSCLLTSQLENQRFYFEELLRDAEKKQLEFARVTDSKMSGLEKSLNETRAECSHLRAELDKVTQSRQQLDKKHQQITQKLQKLQSELEEEKQMGALMRADKQALTAERDELRQQKEVEVADLRDQLHDLMMHFEAQAKIQEQAEKGDITQEELTESHVEVQGQDSSTGSGGVKGKRRKAKK